MRPKIEVTAEMLREHLHYDPKTGVFTRKIATKRSKVGDVVGALNANGYVDICIFCRSFPAHRLAWLYMTGEWPKHYIDHINRVRHNNSFKNLRDVVPRVNQANRKRANKYNHIPTGVRKAWTGDGWTASMFVENKYRYLGLFATEEEAAQAHRDAMREAYPNKRNHDKPVRFNGYVPKIRRAVDAYLVRPE